MLRTKIFEVKTKPNQICSNYNNPESNRTYNFLFEPEPNRTT